MSKLQRQNSNVMMRQYAAAAPSPGPQLSQQQRNLLQRFGLTGDAVRNKAQIASYSSERPGSNAYQAVRLAQAVASGRFGTSRSRRGDRRAARAGGGQAVKWQPLLGQMNKRQQASAKEANKQIAALQRHSKADADFLASQKKHLLSVEFKQQYDKAILNARRRGNTARVQQLKASYKQRRVNQRAQAVAQAAAKKAANKEAKRAARQANLAAKKRVADKLGLGLKGLRSHRLGDVNKNAWARNKKTVAKSLATIVGVLQSFMKMSGGHSLSKAIFTLAYFQAKEMTGSDLIAKGAFGLVKIAPQFVLNWLAKWGLSKLGITLDPQEMRDKLGPQAWPVVQKIASNQDVDIQPLVSAVIMSVKDEQLTQLTTKVIAMVLDSYVFQPYKSSGGPSTLCGVCGAVTCDARPAANRSYYPDKLAFLARKLFAAINDLLSLDGRRLTVTKVMRQAMNTYLTPTVILAIRGGTRVLALESVMKYVAAPLYPFFVKLLNQYGLTIGMDDFAQILLVEFKALPDFADNKPGANIEPLLVKIISKTKPQKLVAGILGGFLQGKSTSEFCTLCKTAYPKCTSKKA